MPENQLVTIQPNGVAPTTGLEPARAYLLTLRSQASRTTMRKRLDQIARMYLHSRWDTCPWPELGKSMSELIIDAELERVSVAYTNQMIAAVRGVMGACFDLHLIDGGHTGGVMSGTRSDHRSLADQLSYRTDDEPRAKENEERSRDAQDSPLKPLAQERLALE